MQSRFAEKVAPLKLRKDQWNRIIEVSVQQSYAMLLKPWINIKNGCQR
jgi:hypothetical protein